MRHLVVCCDGTWQNVAEQADSQLSNVSRLRSAILLPEPADQLHYVRGVGSAGGPWSRVHDGATGGDLPGLVRDGYAFVARTYRPGDRIALFGFSRGAYVARSLAGMIGRVGIVAGCGLTATQLDEAVRRAYGAYRRHEEVRGIRLAYRPTDTDLPIDFIGVWDTVGALGVPDYVALPGLRGSRSRYAFLDVRLDERVPFARHAVSLDEMRSPFRPTLWQDCSPAQDVKQLWFPGDHCDVGGGHPEKGLSDVALEWMMNEASNAVGLKFDPGLIPDFDPDRTARPHGLATGPRGSVGEILYQPRPRATPPVDRARRHPDVHGSAYALQLARSDYRPTTTLAAPGATASAVVRADAAWTATGLWLERGDYRVRARGHWRSAGDGGGPDGVRGLRGPGGREVTGLADAAQRRLRQLLGNPDATLPGTRRNPGHPWLSLVGVVSNEVVDVRGRPVHRDHQFGLGAERVIHVARPGYLYAYPNDTWGFYGNNDGAMDVTVERL